MSNIFFIKSVSYLKKIIFFVFFTNIRFYNISIFNFVLQNNYFKIKIKITLEFLKLIFEKQIFNFINEKIHLCKVKKIFSRKSQKNP